MKRNNGFWAVAIRECHILTSRPLYLFTALIFPLFALFFMSTIFGNGMIDKLPVAIVDEDDSFMSRNITRLCSAVPEITVKHVLSNTAEARDALLSKEIYGYLLIPENFESDVQANKSTSLVLCYHYAFLSVGSEVLQGFLNVLRIIAVEPLQQSIDFLGADSSIVDNISSPISISAHPLYNASLNYSAYLTFPYFWVLFQILILLNIAYSFGNEFKTNKMNECMSKANGRFGIMVLGKLFPYLMIFSSVAIFANVIMFSILGLDLSSSIYEIALVCILFICATCSVSLFIFSLYPNLAIIISFISMFGSLGATFAGVTFPVGAMYPFFEKMSYLFPIRHFVVISDYLRYESSAFPYYWNYLLILASFNILTIISIILLKRRYQHWNY
ncbi:MAG: ABC transporter permease [Bacteroidales bacterium]|nr:ABC transporter permease [Bacteroidales bacterium]